jgi:hypothetical protein
MNDVILIRLRDQERALLACALGAVGGAMLFDEVEAETLIDDDVRTAWRHCVAAVRRGNRPSFLLLAGAGIPQPAHERLGALAQGAREADPLQARDEYRRAAATHRLALTLGTMQGLLAQPDVEPVSLGIEAEAAIRLALDSMGTRRRQSLVDAGEEYVASLRNDTWRVPLPNVLDGRIGGLRRGQMLVILGRSGHGKSCLALTAAMDAAKANLRVLYASREMPAPQLAGRMGAMLLDQSPSMLNEAVRWDDASERELYEALRALGDRIIVDDRSRDVRDVEAEVRRAQLAGEPYHLVVLDFLQQFDGPGEARHEVLEAIAYRMKDLAMQQECAVIAPCQVNRAGSVSETIPGMNAIRGSSGIENAADAIVGIALGERDSNSGDAKLEASIAKARNGVPGPLPPVLRLRANLRVEERT